MGVESMEALLPRASSSSWCENRIICNLEFEGRTRLDVDGVQLKHSKLPQVCYISVFQNASRVMGIFCFLRFICIFESFYK